MGSARYTAQLFGAKPDVTLPTVAEIDRPGLAQEKGVRVPLPPSSVETG